MPLSLQGLPVLPCKLPSVFESTCRWPKTNYPRILLINVYPRHGRQSWKTSLRRCFPTLLACSHCDPSSFFTDLPFFHQLGNFATDVSSRYSLLALSFFLSPFRRNPELPIVVPFPSRRSLEKKKKKEGNTAGNRWSMINVRVMTSRLPVSDARFLEEEPGNCRRVTEFGSWFTRLQRFSLAGVVIDGWARLLTCPSPAEVELGWATCSSELQRYYSSESCCLVEVYYASARDILSIDLR